MMIKLDNIKTNKFALNDSNAVYIGRANKWLGFPESKWHNPFPLKKESERTDVLVKYLNYLLGRKDLLDSLQELDNKTLVCYCTPRKCHGNILILLSLGYNESDILDWIYRS